MRSYVCCDACQCQRPWHLTWFYQVLNNSTLLHSIINRYIFQIHSFSLLWSHQHTTRLSAHTTRLSASMVAETICPSCSEQESFFTLLFFSYKPKLINRRTRPCDLHLNLLTRSSFMSFRGLTSKLHSQLQLS